MTGLPEPWTSAPPCAHTSSHRCAPLPHASRPQATQSSARPALCPLLAWAGAGSSGMLVSRPEPALPFLNVPLLVACQHSSLPSLWAEDCSLPVWPAPLPGPCRVYISDLQEGKSKRPVRPPENETLRHGLEGPPESLNSFSHHWHMVF